MNNPEQEIVEYKIRRAVGINALRKIATIVAAEWQADIENARILSLFKRYGWIVLLGAALLLAYLTGVI